MKYQDISTNEQFPKTMTMQAQPNGAYWQIYHVRDNSEVKMLKEGATRNGYEVITLRNYNGQLEETFSNWRGEQEVSISQTTIKMIEVNIDMDVCDVLEDKLLLSGFVDDLISDYNMMLPDFGENDSDVVLYKNAIKELNYHINN